jgi:hypothetical protein
MTTADINDSFLVPNKATLTDPMHEMYHIFSQETDHEIDKWNAFYSSAQPIRLVESSAQVTDDRRFLPAQQTTIHGSEYAKNP